MKRYFIAASAASATVGAVVGGLSLGWLMALMVAWLVTPAHAQTMPLAWQTSSAYEANHVFLPTRLSNLTISFHTASYRTLMIFDAVAVPGDGGSKVPYVCMEGITQASDPAQEFKSVSFVSNPLIFAKGIAVTVSTSTAGCTTLTSDGSNDWYQVQASGQP